MDDLLSLLRAVRFPKQKRTNISAEPVQGFVLGLVRDFKQQRLAQSRHNKRFQSLWNQCDSFARSHLPHDFTYTSIQINKNVLCPKHRDKNNLGNSAVIAIGDFSNGRLFVDGEPHDVRTPLIFNGAEQEHWTEPFEGERFALVFFTVKPFTQKSQN